MLRSFVMARRWLAAGVSWLAIAFLLGADGPGALDLEPEALRPGVGRRLAVARRQRPPLHRLLRVQLG